MKIKILLVLFCFVFFTGCVEHRFVVKKDIGLMVVPVEEVVKYKAEQEKNYYTRIFGKYSLKLEKDYMDLAAKTGLNIDTDSNDAVDVAYGGTNAATAAAARTSLGAAPTESPTFTGTVVLPSN